MIHVLAVITAKPGKRQDILRAFKANVAAVLAEQGCIEYGATVDALGAPESSTRYGPDTFVVIEKWVDVAALEAHAASSHMTSYAARTRDWIASRSIHVLEAA